MEEDNPHSGEEKEKEFHKPSHEHSEKSLDEHQISIDNNPDKKFDASKFKKTFKKNPWLIATVILAIILLIVIVLMLSGGITGNIITGNVIAGGDAGERLLEFANSQGAGAELVEVNDEGDFYEVVLSIRGQEMPVYVTKDGKYFTQTLISLDKKITPTNPDTQTQDIPKSDKPKVELFVMSHCPC